MTNIPNLFIVGAPKSGTTALANNISQHKEIFIPSKKEPRYFDAHTFYDYKEDYPVKSLDEYMEYYNTDTAGKCKYRLDASVFNIFSSESINNILKISPDAKFILVIRDPVEGCIQMHSQRLKYADPKMREVSDDFNKCWETLPFRKKGKGYPKNCRNKFLFRYDLLFSYELYLPNILNLVQRDNLFVGFYDDFEKNPEIFYSKILKFLDIQALTIENKRVNESYRLKPSKMLQYIDCIAKKSQFFKIKLGLSSRKMHLFKKMIFDKYKIISPVHQKADEKVYEAFSNTYKYLSELKESDQI